MYGELGKDVVEIIKKFMRDEAGELIDGRVHRNYGLYVCSNCTKTECIRVHVVSEREKYLDDFNRHLEYRPKCRGGISGQEDIYVAIVGNVNEETILNNIRE